MEGKRAHVFDKGCGGHLGGFVAIVCDGLLEEAFHGHHALAEDRDTGIVKVGSGHCENVEIFGLGLEGERIVFG